MTLFDHNVEVDWPVAVFGSSRVKPVALPALVAPDPEDHPTWNAEPPKDTVILSDLPARDPKPMLRCDDCCRVTWTGEPDRACGISGCAGKLGVA